MAWGDGHLLALIVRLDPGARARVEDHRDWLAERRAPAAVSLAEAARDLLERGLATTGRRRREAARAEQLELFAATPTRAARAEAAERARERERELMP